MSEAVSFEAKLYAYRKGKDGLIVSFVVHPSDVPNQLALADIGQRFGVALAQLGAGDEQAAEQPALRAPVNEAKSERAKADHRFKTPQEQAMARYAILCDDLHFQRWLEEYSAARGRTIPDQPGKDATAKLLRMTLAIDSRREIGEGGRAYRLFLDLEQKYKESLGMAAERRG